MKVSMDGFNLQAYIFGVPVVLFLVSKGMTIVHCVILSLHRIRIYVCNRTSLRMYVIVKEWHQKIEERMVCYILIKQSRKRDILVLYGKQMRVPQLVHSKVMTGQALLWPHVLECLPSVRFERATWWAFSCPLDQISWGWSSVFSYIRKANPTWLLFSPGILLVPITVIY